MWLSIAMLSNAFCQSSHSERPIGASPRATLRLQRSRRAGHRRWSWWYKRGPHVIRWLNIGKIAGKPGHIWKWRIFFPSKKKQPQQIYIYICVCIWVSYSVNFHHHYPIQLWELEEIEETHLAVQGSNMGQYQSHPWRASGDAVTP